MRQILLEAKESLMKRKLFSSLLFIITTCLLILLSTLYLNWFNVDTKTKSYYAQYQGENIYQISDELINDREKQFFSDSSELEVIKKFYSYLNQQNRDFTYIYTNNQSIGVHNFKGSEKFIYGYETNSLQPDFEKNGLTFKVAKAIQINENVLYKFDLPLFTGRGFKKADFINQNNNEIPIILGAEYASLYKEGDIFNIDYLNKPFKVKVIGILKSNVNLPVRDDLEFYLDRYIIMPNIIMGSPSDAESLAFQQKSYLSAINGQVFSELDKLQVRKALEGISKKTGFYDYQLIGANDKNIDFMLSMLSVNKKILTAFALLLLIFSVISIALSLTVKWNVNMKKYAIHLISGATINKLMIYIFFELLIVMSISLISVFIYMRTLGLISYTYYVPMIIVVLSIILMGMIPLYMKLKKLNISEMLKRRV